MTVPLHHGLKKPDSQSKTVNIFDLTGTNTETPGSSRELSAKERAVRIAFILVVGMIVMTAMLLLMAEVVGLQWSRSGCPDPQPFKMLEWSSLFQSDKAPYPYEDYWKSLSLAEKRQEMFRTTYGEIDLYDMYDELKLKELHKTDTHPHEDVVH